MAVVINDFEVLTEPQPANTGTAGPSQQRAPAPPELRPEDIERIIRHFEERRARLAAD